MHGAPGHAKTRTSSALIHLSGSLTLGDLLVGAATLALAWFA